jgi:hypothetical protein
MAKVSIGLRCDAPAMTPWAPCRGEGRQRPLASARVRHTRYCIVSLLIRHTVDEPPLIANVGGHSHEEEVGRNLMRPMQYA